jgi:hypothetical protein
VASLFPNDGVFNPQQMNITTPLANDSIWQGKYTPTIFFLIPSLETFLRKDHTGPSALCGWEIYYSSLNGGSTAQSSSYANAFFYFSTPVWLWKSVDDFLKRNFNREHLSSVLTSNEQGQT